MYYMREEYKPWELIKAKTLQGAKRAAAKKTAGIGTRVQIVEHRFGRFEVVAVRWGRSHWQDF